LWHFRLSRDILLFVFGAAGFFHELLFSGNRPERPMILTVSAAMMGLSVFGRASENIRNGKRNGSGKP
jgi:hypothetical protein